MSADVVEGPLGASPAVVEDPGGPASRRRVRRVPDWLLAPGVGLLAALICLIPLWRGTFFYYVGDQHEQFAPLWHSFGRQLRDGQWPAMDPAAWAGGNYAAEALTGIWNPVNLGNFVLTSYFDDLSLAAAVVMIEMLAILAMGVFLLAREYGAGRVAAVVVATALPVSGFTLWYEASGWPAGLMAFTWVTHFWWSARRHARGRLIPLVPFLFGYLAMTTGNPYAALGLVVVLAALGLELLVQRRFARLAHLLVVGACVGAVALMVYLPLLGSGSVSARQELAKIANDTFLVPDVGDLAAASSPTYLPAMLNWNGALLERVPSTYLAWFVLPLLPWLDWPSVRRRAGSLLSLAAVAGFYLLATLGPSNLWLFRWPVRLIEYLWLAVAVAFAVALSAGRGRGRVRQRAVLSGAIVVVGAYLAWAVQPADLDRVHAAGLVVVGVLTALAVLAWSRHGARASGAVLVAGTAVVVGMQTTVFPHPTADPATYPAYSLPAMEEGAPDHPGTVLQLAQLEGVTSEQRRSGEILFGNVPRALGVDTVTSYSGIGFLEFYDELCMDYRGATCAEAFDRIWATAGDGVPVPLVDAMRISSVVLQRSLLPEAAQQAPPEGWRVAERTPVRTVWVREQPLEGPGRVSWTSPGLEVLDGSATPGRETVRYRADEDGRVLFARLTWPGYRATVDGRAVEVTDGPAGLLAVDVPAGTGTLVLSHTPPGLRLGAVVAGAAAGIVLLQTVLWWWLGRRQRPSGAVAQFRRRGV